jgi:hypothetical protein
MKLEHLFLGICALLLATTGLLAVHYRTELLLERQKNGLAHQPPPIPKTAPGPHAAPTRPAGTLVESPASIGADAGAEQARLQKQLQIAEEEKNLLTAKVKTMEANKAAGLPPDADPLTPTQIKIKELPAIAAVKQYLPEHGILVLDHGTDRGLKTDQKYAVRRGAYIVANPIQIGENVDATECAAIVGPSALQPGEVLKPGDEVIQWE